MAMKPETIARRKRQRAIDKAKRKTERIRQLKRLVRRDGHSSIWSELLAMEY